MTFLGRWGKGKTVTMKGPDQNTYCEKQARSHNSIDLFQELRSLEAELYDKQREQRQTEERLKQREKELAAREIDLLERELNIMILQQVG